MRALDLSREGDTAYLQSLTPEELREFNRLRDVRWQDEMRRKGYSVTLSSLSNSVPPPPSIATFLAKPRTTITPPAATKTTPKPAPRRCNQYGVEDAPSLAERIMARRQRQ